MFESSYIQVQEGVCMKKLIFLPFLLALAGCRTTRTIPVVSGFETDKYLGQWYEIARLPNWFERGMSDISAEYSRLPDNSLQVINRGMKNGKKKSVTGKVRQTGKGDTGELEVCFFRPFYASYRIIKLAPDYRYSVVMGDSQEYLWILSRTPHLDPVDLQEIIAFLETHGFPVNKLIFSQTAS